jgi:hypothetical protein
MNDIFWDSYREELITTAIVLVLAVLVSLFAARTWYSNLQDERAAESTYKEKLRQEEIADQLNAAFGEVMGQTQEEPDTTAAVQGITPKPTAAQPTSQPIGDAVEVPFGYGGKYTYDEYILELDRPRLRIGSDQSRTFIVEMKLTNNIVNEGLPIKVSGVIVQDGSVIVQDTALSTSVSGVVMPGDSMQFQARMALLEGTDLAQVWYKPQNVVDTVEHVLKP